MKQKYLFIVLIIFFKSHSAFAALQKISQKETDSLQRPKLVIGIVVDQMRWDYLYRFYDRYSENGFKRLLKEGFSCENTQINYIPTVTAVGHSSIFTGSTPALHGIVGNEFILQKTGKTIYCAQDDEVQTIGSSGNSGKMSPKNLTVTTITDELKLATNFRSKVVGVSLKDRGAILPAGHLADAAYWYDDASAKWISSSYYMSSLPKWLDEFNEQNLADKYLSQGWNTLYPINTYIQSIADDNPYEVPFGGNTNPVFPVNTYDLKSKIPGLIRSTPYGNLFTIKMAEKAIESERLGRNVVTDFLTMSLSSTDYVGHQFGPNSVEIEDTYLRLDQYLSSFFTYLDETIGRGTYTVFLTADHGAPQISGFANDHGLPGGLFPEDKVKRALNTYLEEKYQQRNLVLSLNSGQVNLNNTVIEEKKLSEKSIRADCVNFLQKIDGVDYVQDMDNIFAATIPSFLKERIINSYNRERAGVIQIVLKAGWYSGGNRGVSHSAGDPADAHIPLLWMGWGINQGRSAAPVNITDIAPTLAALLHVQAPSGCIGRPILEVLNLLDEGVSAVEKQNTITKMSKWASLGLFISLVHDNH